MTDDTTYNGWTNRATWLVALWIDNDQGSHESVCEMARDAWADTDEDDTKENRTIEAVAMLADSLEAMHDEGVAEMVGCTGVFADLMSDALASVNWDEIARQFVEYANEVTP